MPTHQPKNFQQLLKLLEQPSGEYPAALEALWPKVSTPLAKELLKKNWSLWARLWAKQGAKSYLTGARVHATKSGIPYSGEIGTRSKEYFLQHGLDLVKGMTETDLQTVKDGMLEWWGVGEEQFARNLSESYVASPERLKTIYRTEHHDAQNQGAQDLAKEVGHDTKTWFSAHDERSCPICGEQLHEKTIPIDEEFVAYYTRKDGSEIEIRVQHPPAHPRCYSHDTEVFTENGWKLFKNVLPDEKIWTLNLTNNQVELSEQINQVRYWYEGCLIHFNGSAIDCLITPDHSMLVANSNGFELIDASKVAPTDRILLGFLPEERTISYDYSINSVKYNDIVYCVEMEKNNTLYVRRNGKANWAGNCRCSIITTKDKTEARQNARSNMKLNYSDDQPRDEK